MKPKLIFFPFDLFSHYLRCLQLAEAVRDDFQVLLAQSNDPKSNAEVLNRGFGLVACKTIDAARMSLMESRLDHTWLSQAELEPVFLDQVRVLREYAPALIISDFSITLGMAAEYVRVPCYALTIGHLSQYSYMHRRAPDSHPAIRVLKKLHCPAPLLEIGTAIGTRLEFRRMHTGIRGIRKKYRLRPRKDYLDELGCHYNLITDIEDFSPMRHLPSNYTYVGPIFHRHPSTEDEVLSALDPNKATVLVSLGTFWSSDQLFALLNDPGFRAFNVVIAGKPGIALDPAIAHKPFVNLEAILPKTDVLICHGGDATVYQALSHAVPMLGFPFHGEQLWSLQRVENLNFGEAIQATIDSSTLLQKVRYWIDKKANEKSRFEVFAQNISLASTQKRFRDVILRLNQRVSCPFCRQGTLEKSREIVNVPSDVRRFQNQYFQVWRCFFCSSLFSVPTLDLRKYYDAYPYDAIQNNWFVDKALRNLYAIAKGYGLKTTSSVLFSGALSPVVRDVFQRCGVASFDVLERPLRIDDPWVFPDRKFDFIILLDCLERSADVSVLLSGARDCLSPGGRVLLQSPDAEEVSLKRAAAYVHELHQPYRPHILSRSVLLTMAHGCGLETQACLGRHFWDTAYPFVNQKTIHAVDALSDGSVDATVRVSNIVGLLCRRWWKIPGYVLTGLLGGVFPKKAAMMVVLEHAPPN